MNINCIVCGRSFRIKPSRLSTARCCSRECEGIFRRNDRKDFDALVDRSGGPDACWPWQGSKFEKGYGAYSHAGKTQRANRWAFFYAYGVFPSDVARHTCDNPSCCNPKHIIDGTQLENVADRDNRQRTARGIRTGTARLTEEQVQKFAKIRERSETSHAITACVNQPLVTSREEKTGDMSLPVEAFPLSWPAGWDRTPSHRRRSSKYRIEFARARDEVVHSLSLMGISRQHVIISTCVPLRRDGLPYAGWHEPDDPGVAVYWESVTWARDGNSTETKQHVLPCDAWRTVRENMRAIGLALEAMRQLERTGAKQILDRAFSGFVPELPGRVEESWQSVLGIIHGGVTVTAEKIEERYRALALEAHPDRGGSHEAMVRLNRAREQALAFLRIG